jgi:transcriptional regulator with XRE-family HTH domain
MLSMRTLREIRQEKKLTLEEISGLTGLTVPHLSWIETGKMIPKISTKIRLKRIFGGEIDFEVLDNSSNTIPSDYEQCQYEFRYLIKMIKSLTPEEQVKFCSSVVKHFVSIQQLQYK